MTPLWVYPEGHEPDWLDLSGDDQMTGADSEAVCEAHAARAELANVRCEVVFLRWLCVGLVVLVLIQWFHG